MSTIPERIWERSKRERMEKAEADRDEALSKLKEQREWSDQYRDCMWAEHDRGEEALAQVAMLSAAINDTREAQIQHRLTGTWVMDRLDKALSNLPAAAKELLEDRVRLNMVRGLYREAGQLYESCCKERKGIAAENARLREALESMRFGDPTAEVDEYCWCVLSVVNGEHSDRCQKAQAALSPGKSD